MSNNNSIWFAVDEDGTEWWFTARPYRSRTFGKKKYWTIHYSNDDDNSSQLFPGAIQVITGRTLSWQDEPLEWKPKDISQ